MLGVFPVEKTGSPRAVWSEPQGGDRLCDSAAPGCPWKPGGWAVPLGWWRQRPERGKTEVRGVPTFQGWAKEWETAEKMGEGVGGGEPPGEGAAEQGCWGGGRPLCPLCPACPRLWRSEDAEVLLCGPEALGNLEKVRG